MFVSIIGTGRLGRSLDVLLRQSDRVDCEVELLGRDGVPGAPVVLLAVPDGAIAEAARRIPEGRVALHCSGTTPVDVLRPHQPAGSFHPLMTFPGPDVGLPDLAGVPAAIDGDPEARAAARALADALSMRAIIVPGDRRLYHAAAVIAGNFATVLLAEASRVLAGAGVDPDEAPALLAPLAVQSLKNAGEKGPAAALTGPVARGDTATLDGHRDALLAAGLDDLVPLYDALTGRARRLVDEKGVVVGGTGAKV
jgi:predicted short-subunit dehydrogenase-like oxidoreductase (DUF2520 family)